jgi:glutamine amidotransferase
LKRVGFKVEVISSKKTIGQTDAVVIPGVGNFTVGSKNLEKTVNQIYDIVDEGKPLLGICLGMQLLFEKSEEGIGSGLSIFRGIIKRIPDKMKTPHMGWNSIVKTRENELLTGIHEDSCFYFVHSYYPIPENSEIIIAETEYGINFASIIADKNVYGTQFHPEKSGKNGEQILKNFMSIVRK